MKRQPFLRAQAFLTSQSVVSVYLTQRFQYKAASGGKVLRHAHKVSPTVGETVAKYDSKRVCSIRLWRKKKAGIGSDTVSSLLHSLISGLNQQALHGILWLSILLTFCNIMIMI